jgi:hypothetical protein
VATRWVSVLRYCPPLPRPLIPTRSSSRSSYEIQPYFS